MKQLILGISLILLLVAMGVSTFFLGKSYGYEAGYYYASERLANPYDGCWASVNSGNQKGDWVCVNVEGMKYERALEVCKHEVGHEIFAEECEKDIDKCFAVVEGLEQ